MKHLIKQYYHFFGEIIRPEKVFPISLNCFHQSNDLTHFLLSQEFPIPIKTNREALSVGFFLLPTHLKINTQNEEERLNFDH
jgi:hypothetical protein